MANEVTVKPGGAAVWAALTTVYVVWGSTYLAIRVVVEAGIPPILGMGMRFLAASVIFIAIIAMRDGWSSLRVSAREFRGAAIMGILLLVGGNGLVAVSEQTVPSGLTALIIGAVPLWFVLLRFSGGDRPAPLTWLGVLVGFVGIGTISLPRGGIEGVETWGVIVLLTATISWSVGSYLSPRLNLPKRTAVTASYEMLVAGLLMTAGASLFGDLGRLRDTSISTDGWLALAYLIIFGSLLAFTAYGYALANAPLSLVGTYAYVNPVVAVFLGWLILSEPITTVVVGGGALVVVGVALVVSAERPTPARGSASRSVGPVTTPSRPARGRRELRRPG